MFQKWALQCFWTGDALLCYNISVWHLLALRYFPGPYDAFITARDEAQACKLRQIDAQDRQRKHMETSIAAAERAAKVSGDDKRLGLAASRKKKLEDRMGMEKTADGKKFKVSYWAGYHETKRPQVGGTSAAVGPECC